ncbi:MAG: Fpg/Nei family DNA glycosylase [Chloroflexota bacterium]
MQILCKVAADVPEGHTIHRLARDHTRDLAGQIIHVSSPQGRHPVLSASLDGQRLQTVRALGKHLLYAWDGGPILHIHLGLFGRFLTVKSPPPDPKPSVQLRMAGDVVAVDLIGATTCELLDDNGHQRLVDRLGPDLLAEDADPERAWTRLSRRSIPIAAALLDQTILSGVGNVYRVEALFVNAIHPDRPANSLSRAEFTSLWSTLQSMLRQGVEEWRIITVHPSERTSDGEIVRPEDAFYVYKQQRCRRCGGPIRTWRMGARYAYACEACQPVSGSANVSRGRSRRVARPTRRSASPR